MTSKNKKTQSNTESPRDDLTEEYLLSNLSLLVLNCLLQNNDFEIQSNDEEYRPWNNIAAKIDGTLLCIVVSHIKKFNYKTFFTNYIEKRTNVLDRLQTDINPLFVYYKTSKERSVIHEKFTLVEKFPSILNLIVTESNEIWQETIKDPEGNVVDYGNTFICINQHDCSEQIEDIKWLLKEYLQLDLSSDDIKDKWLYDIEKEYLNFVRNWYHSKKESLTSDDVQRAISDFILKKFKLGQMKTNLSDGCVKWKKEIHETFSSVTDISTELKKIIKTHYLVVINHKFASTLLSKIWNYLEVDDAGKLSEEKLNLLWCEKSIHMPFVSDDNDSDKLILLALKIRKITLKTILLRFRRFDLEESDTFAVSLLNDLPISGSFSLPENEDFRYSIVTYDDFLTHADRKLHIDSFCRAIRDNDLEYLSGITMIEALDEYHFVNEFHRYEDEDYALPAIHACIKLVAGININKIHELLEMKTEIDIPIHGGITPLLAAIKVDRVDIVHILLERGANTELANSDSDMPLHVACRKSQTDVVRLLLKYGADVNALDLKRRTPYEVAIDLEVQLLLKSTS